MTLLRLLLSLLMPVLTLQAGAANDQASLRVMSYNVRNGRGLDDKTDYNRIAEVIKRIGPDVVAVQELDKETSRSGKVDVLKKIAELTGMEFVYAPAINHQGGEYGLGILSKEKPLGSRYIALPGREEKRVFLAVEFEHYVMCCVHLSLTEEDRIESVKLINELVSAYSKPVVIAGDFNAEPDSETIKGILRFCTLLSSGKEATFPANKPRELIDYIFGCNPEKGRFQVKKAKVVDEPVASDHRPIIVDIVLPR